LSVIVRIWNEFQLRSIFWVVGGRRGDLRFLLLVSCLFCLFVCFFFGGADFGSLLDCWTWFAFLWLLFDYF
jgi:hypothetical protein